MKFLIQEGRAEQNFSLIYRAKDYSFDVEPLNESGDTSILINDLQLEIDHEGKILYVWGYCPLIKYEETDQAPKEYKTHSLVVLLDKPPILGVSYKLNEKERWPLYINKKKGWVCIGNPLTKEKNMVEFAPNCIATIERQEITAVWLQPKRLPELN